MTLLASSQLGSACPDLHNPDDAPQTSLDFSIQPVMSIRTCPTGVRVAHLGFLSPGVGFDCPVPVESA